MCGVLNTAKTWKTTRMKIDRTILACFKETFLLPYFSIKCTDKANAVMEKYIYKAVAVLMDIEPSGTRRD